MTSVDRMEPAESATIEELIYEYQAEVQRLVTDEHIRVFVGMPVPPPKVTVTYGPRYARVIIEREDGKRRTAHSFVDLTTGDILRAAGWRRPALHPHGSVKDLGKGGFTSHLTWGDGRADER